MYTIRSENIDGSSERRGYRRDEDCETPALMFFNDECGDESLLNLGERRLPRLVLRLSGQLLSETSKESVAGDSFE